MMRVTWRCGLAVIHWVVLRNLRPSGRSPVVVRRRFTLLILFSAWQRNPVIRQIVLLVRKPRWRWERCGQIGRVVPILKPVPILIFNNLTFLVPLLFRRMIRLVFLILIRLVDGLFQVVKNRVLAFLVA